MWHAPSQAQVNWTATSLEASTHSTLHPTHLSACVPPQPASYCGARRPDPPRSILPRHTKTHTQAQPLPGGRGRRAGLGQGHAAVLADGRVARPGLQARPMPRCSGWAARAYGPTHTGRRAAPHQHQPPLGRRQRPPSLPWGPARVKVGRHTRRCLDNNAHVPLLHALTLCTLTSVARHNIIWSWWCRNAGGSPGAVSQMEADHWETRCVIRLIKYRWLHLHHDATLNGLQPLSQRRQHHVC